MTGQDDGQDDDLVMAPDTASGMERRLLDAFAVHHAAVRDSGPRGTRLPWSTRRRWIAAAAALLIVAAGAEAWRVRRSAHLGSQASTAADGRDAQRHGRDSPSANAGVAGAGDVQPGVPRPVAGTRAAIAAPLTRPGKRPPRPPQGVPADAQGTEFVALPGAAGLPEFESGSIVRVELPVASLPRYGVDISRAAGEGAVSADLLVGQDGEARGIRLVAAGNSLNTPRSGK